MKKQDKVQAEVSGSNEIAKGTSIKGDIETYGNIRVDGKIDGNLSTESKAVFGLGSELTGTMNAKNAEIEGTIKGDVLVKEVLVLKKDALIEGNIITNKLVVESGAKFNGTCQMGENVEKLGFGSHEHGRSNGQAKKSTAVPA